MKSPVICMALAVMLSGCCCLPDPGCEKPYARDSDGNCCMDSDEDGLCDTTTTTLKYPEDRESCEAAGGRWGYIGLSPRESCNLPTSDAGKECSGSEYCEGECLADLTEDDWDRAMKGETVNTKGKCSTWRITVGCHAFVENGKAEIICFD